MKVGPNKIGYARVSTSDQNLDLQIRALEKAGCSVIYRDEGVSAVANERPEFALALACLRAGDTLVIWKMDRAFRSLINALNVLEDLELRGVEFQSLTDEIDTTTAMGRFVYQIRNAFSELERAIISERTKAGLAAAKARGVTLGRPRKLSGEQIKRARREFDSGRKTMTRLAKELNVATLTLSRALAKDEKARKEYDHE
jgi:DNA invertase Pin-like site-specific DNA recombinase